MLMVMLLLMRKLKILASEIKRGLRLAPREVSVLDARKVCTDITMKSWQRKWDEEKTGRRTYEITNLYLWLEQGFCGQENVTSEFHVAECYYMTRC